MPELNLIDTQTAGGAVGRIRSPYLMTEQSGAGYGDTAGNGYLEYGTGTPGSLPFRVDQAGNVTAAGLNFSGTFSASSLTSSGSISAAGTIYASALAATGSLGLYLGNMVILAPSGDHTGATDTTAVNTALSAGNPVYLLPGTFYQNAAWQVTQSSTGIVGSGANATSIAYAAGGSMSAQIAVGGTAVIQNCVLGGFQVFGGSLSGHNIQWRAKSSILRTVTLQASQNDGLHLDPNTIGSSISDNVMFDISVIHPGGNGFYQDTHVNDSDYYSMTLDGGTSGDTVAGGSIGINVTGGANNRFFGCHPFLFASGGVNLSGLGNNFFGGEFESNGSGTLTADLIITNAHECSVVGVNFYDHANPSPPSSHILMNGTGSGKVNIAECTWREDTYNVPAFAINSNGSNSVKIHDCPGYNPVGSFGTVGLVGSGNSVTNAFNVDCTVYLTGGTVTGVMTGGGSVSLASGTFRVAAGGTLALNYTGSPVMTWMGD